MQSLASGGRYGRERRRREHGAARQGGRGESVSAPHGLDTRVRACCLWPNPWLNGAPARLPLRVAPGAHGSTAAVERGGAAAKRRRKWRSLQRPTCSHVSHVGGMYARARSHRPRHPHPRLSLLGARVPVGVAQLAQALGSRPIARPIRRLVPSFFSCPACRDAVDGVVSRECRARLRGYVFCRYSEGARVCAPRAI